jgi:hypothetical protein
LAGAVLVQLGERERQLDRLLQGSGQTLTASRADAVAFERVFVRAGSCLLNEDQLAGFGSDSRASDFFHNRFLSGVFVCSKRFIKLKFLRFDFGNFLFFLRHKAYTQIAFTRWSKSLRKIQRRVKGRSNIGQNGGFHKNG